MKKLLVILLFLPLFSLAQQYSEVIELPNKSAVQSYRSANEWFAVKFNSAKDVIQLNDSIQKKIIAKGVQVVNHQIGKVVAELNVFFTLIVQFKDGKYKYDLTIDEIKTQGAQQFTYNELKEMATEEGLIAYNKRMGISWSMGNKMIGKVVESNKLIVTEIDQQLKGMINDLTAALKKDTATTNW